jgi:outer membrane protein assembly factor BamB
VAGISMQDGKQLWSYAGWQCPIPIPFPTLLPDDRLFITGGYDAGSAMIQVKQVDGKFEVKELFKTMVCGSQIHQPILFKDYLYINSNTNEREDGLMCLAFDGQVKWKTDGTPNPKFDKGNLLMVDNLIVMLDGKKGTLHLIDPSPEGYKELAQAKLFDGKEIWAPMAISNGKLLCRNQVEMKCLDLKNP